jgi:hypothetical protein
MSIDWCAEVRRGVDVVDIGQITPEQRRALRAMVRTGEAVQYRGYWAYWGMGPLKTRWRMNPEYQREVQS